MNSTIKQQIVKKLNDLYIGVRYKYLVQYPGGKYQHCEQPKLNDGHLKAHLDGKYTVGVFGGKLTGSKFICFDVDSQDMVTSKHVAFKLVHILMDTFNIPSKYIQVSFSGNKGYHIELFFDSFIKEETLKQFYKIAVNELGDHEDCKVEFRPTASQGVKLPLGKHQKTRRRCWYVDVFTFEPIKSLKYVLSIEPMSTEEFLDLLNDVVENGQAIDLTNQQAADVEEVASKTQNLDATVKTADELEMEAAEILNLGRLKYPNTRHKTTLLLATFLLSYGWDEEDVVDRILELLHNTPREFFSKDSTPEFWEKETKRLVNYVFENNWALVSRAKDIKLYKSELLRVLEAKSLNQKLILFAMLVHSKRYARKDSVFWMTYDTLEKMTGLTRATLISNINKLEDAGLVTVVERNVVDKALSKEKGFAYKKPNKYVVNIPEPQKEEQYIVIPAKEEVNLFESVVKLIPQEECKKKVPRSQYSRHFLEHYSQAI